MLFFLYLTLPAGVAQLARASAFQAEGCEFESRHPLFFVLFWWDVAKLVRRRALNPVFVGSSPTIPVFLNLDLQR